MNTRPYVCCLIFLQYLAILTCISCRQPPEAGQDDFVSTSVAPRIWQPADEAAMVAANAQNENERLRYRLIESRVTDKNDIFLPLYDVVSGISESAYRKLEPLILEQDIPTIQAHIEAGRLGYEQLTLFYLYRIYHFELHPDSTLNTVLALNKMVLQEAKARDSSLKSNPGAAKHL